MGEIGGKEHGDATTELTLLPDCRIFWIDGYNLLHASLGGQDRSEWWSAQRRTELIKRVEGFRGEFDAIRIVFDGPRPTPETQDPAPIEVLFAPSADEWIRKALRDAERPEAIAIVTGDRPVADRARHRGAQIVSPKLFLACCGSAQAPDQELA